jgi:hypothetical protein
MTPWAVKPMGPNDDSIAPTREPPPPHSPDPSTLRHTNHPYVERPWRDPPLSYLQVEYKHGYPSQVGSKAEQYCKAIRAVRHDTWVRKEKENGSTHVVLHNTMFRIGYSPQAACLSRSNGAKFGTCGKCFDSVERRATRETAVQAETRTFWLRQASWSHRGRTNCASRYPR